MTEGEASRSSETPANRGTEGGVKEGNDKKLIKKPDVQAPKPNNRDKRLCLLGLWHRLEREKSHINVQVVLVSRALSAIPLLGLQVIMGLISSS